MDAEKIQSLSPNERKQAYERFLQQLTIVGREIGLDENLTDQERADAMKLLNEINHTLHGAIANSSEYVVSELIAGVSHHADQSSKLREGVEWAWSRAVSSQQTA